MTESSVSVSATQVELDSIQVRSATFRDVPAGDRARLADELGRLPADERVLLDTCHRVELVSVGAAAAGAVHGTAAVRRVFEVVAGFDSAVVAEEQLLGQVRGAYEAALAEGRTGPILNELFRRALRFGRRVRSHARPGTDRSLADPGVGWLLERVPPGTRVVVAGTGEMGRLLAGRLAGAGHRVTLVSGSADRAGAILETLPGEGHHLHVGPVQPALLGQAAGVALAVRTREPILTRSALGEARPWTLDLSAPPAVDPDARSALGERLLTLDALGGMAGGRPVLAPATERRLRAELEDEVDAFGRWLDARRGGEALAILHGEADALRRRHLDRLRSRTRLSDEQFAAVEATSAAMLRDLLHGPSLELRRGGADAAAVRRLFGVDA